MATKERRSTTERRSIARKAAPKPDSRAGARRKPTSEQRAAPFQTNARAEMSAEEIRDLIAEAAYYRAKQRGFEPGHELEDWVEAEAEVLQRIGAS